MGASVTESSSKISKCHHRQSEHDALYSIDANVATGKLGSCTSHQPAAAQSSIEDSNIGNDDSKEAVM